MKPKKARTATTEEFQKALEKQPPNPRYVLRLFVTGSTPRSARAIENIRAICDERLKGKYDLEVVDIQQHPEQIASDQIVCAPTLVKKLPAPVRRIIGDLSDKERVLVGLNLVTQSTAGKSQK